MIASAAPPLPLDLVEHLRRLKLATMRVQAAEVLQTARTQRWGAEDVLRTLLEAEIAARDAANGRMRLKQAGFPVPKTLEAFNVAESSILHAQPLSTSLRSSGCAPRRTYSWLGQQARVKATLWWAAAHAPWSAA
jgi:hypothetical protein